MWSLSLTLECGIVKIFSGVRILISDVTPVNCANVVLCLVRYYFEVRADAPLDNLMASKFLLEMRSVSLPLR